MAHHGGFQGFGYRVVRMPRWAAFLIVTASVLVGILFLVLAAGIALIAIPVVLVAGGIATWLGRRRGGPGRTGGRTAADGRNGRGGVVEGEYIVLDQHHNRTDDDRSDPNRPR